MPVLFRYSTICTASLNGALKTAVQAQLKNEALLTIMSANLSDTSKDQFFSTRPHLAEI